MISAGNNSSVEQNSNAPALLKFFHAQTYFSLFGIILARIVLPFIDGSQSDVAFVFYSFALLYLLITGIAAVAGIHSRARWAPAWAANFSFTFLLFTVAVFCQLFLVSASFLPPSYVAGYDPVVLLHGLALVPVPVCYAWFRYFNGSRAVYAFFKPGEEPVTKLPCLSIALLRLVCAVFLIFYLFASAASCLPFIDENSVWQIAGVALVMQGPNILLPLALLGFSYTRCSRKTLCVFIVVYLVLTFFLPAVRFDIGRIIYSEHSDLLYKIAMLGGNDQFLEYIVPFALVLLFWRIGGSAADAGFFTRAGIREEGVLFTVTGPLLLVGYVTLYLHAFFARSIVNLFRSQSFSFDTLSIFLAFALLAGLGLYCIRGLLRRKASVLALSALLLFASGLLLIQFQLKMKDEYSDFFIQYFISHIIILTACFAGAVWLFRQFSCFSSSQQYAEGPGTSIFINGPNAALLGISIFTGVGAISAHLFPYIAGMLTGELFENISYFTFSKLLYAIAYEIDTLLAYVACPAVAISIIKKGGERSKHFHALCFIWVGFAFSSTYGFMITANNRNMWESFYANSYFNLDWLLLGFACMFFCACKKRQWQQGIAAN